MYPTERNTTQQAASAHKPPPPHTKRNFKNAIRNYILLLLFFRTGKTQLLA